MSKPPIKTSPLFHAFVEKLIILNRDDKILRDARKELRSEVRRNFRDNFAEFLRVDAAGNYLQTEIAAAHQFSEEKVKFLTQGSYAYHMLNRPQQNRQQMDLDDGIYFRMSDINDRLNLNPNLLFSFVERCLSSLASDHGWKMQTMPTCIRLEIGEDKHIDLPLYIVPDNQFSKIQAAAAQVQQFENFGIPYFPYIDDENIWMAHRKEKWIKSDPRKIIEWVGDCKEEYFDRFRPLCRIMKAWRDHQWEKSPLSSICTMRMVEMALENKPKYSKDPNCELDYLLYEVICYMYNIVSQNIAVDDPADASKRLDDKIDNKRSDIVKKLEELVNVMRDVLFNDGKQEDKNKKLREVFGKFFPFDFSKISGCGKVTAAVTGAVAITTQAAARPYASENHLIETTNYRAIAEDEREWLRKNQPLLFVDNNNTIKGTFQLRAELCDKEKRLLNLHQFAPESPGESYIEDSYRIYFGLDATNGLPKVWETEGKILEQLKPHGISKKINAHIFPANDMLCLGSIGELRMKTWGNSTLPFIVDELITPYFYYHSYWAKRGEEPWGGLSHDGDTGILRNYYEWRDSALNPLDWLLQLSPKTLFGIIHNKKIGANDKCFCRKGVKAKNCNCKAVAGYEILRKKTTEYLQHCRPDHITEARHALYKFHSSRWKIAS